MTEPAHLPDEPAQPHRRRTRYRGTHPREFQERYKELAPNKYPQEQEHVRQQGRTPAGTHVPIMVGEVVDVLQPKAGEVVADCTLGYGGHAAVLAERIGPAGRLVGFDLDATQLERTRQTLEGLGVPLSLHHSNFAGLGNVLRSEHLAGYDIIFADLGVSSMQIDDPARGFSYKYDGPLDMRMDMRLKKTAADLIASLPEDKLSAALKDLADEDDHERIAAAIVRQRLRGPIRHTFELVDLVMAVKGLTRKQWGQRPPEQRQDLHPAARTFQTLRILVNDELGSLRQLLRMVPYCLKPGGRFAILTFHSGEQSLVETAFAAGLADGTYGASCPAAIRPTAQEVAGNPRARAARLWWATKGFSG